MRNPLLQKSPLPYELPAFEQLTVEHFEQAFEVGMREHRREVAAIAENSEPASFDNTVVALERAGESLERAQSVFFNLVHSNSSPELDALQVRLAPELAAHQDELYLNDRLFERIDRLYQARAKLGLDAEAAQLLARLQLRFQRAGASLSQPDKVRLRAINRQLSELTTDFQQRVLQGANAAALVVDDGSLLAGLSEAELAMTREAAIQRELSGQQQVLALVNTTGQPWLARLENRELRRRLFDASVKRGLPESARAEHVTTSLISEIVRLRAERARLLGYGSHAEYVLADETAGTAVRVREMLGRLTPGAVANARAEAEALQACIRARGHCFELEPWDWDYYSERVRKERFDFDEAEVRPYLELGRVLESGVLFAAEALFGLKFEEREDLRAYHPDVRVFEVFDADATSRGLCLVDWFARGNKRGGAWMSSFVRQSRLLAKQPVVVTNLNVPKPPVGQPALMTFDEVTTAFHEFGHALHGLLSDVRYPTLSGTSVPTDFVEFPSQLNEMWTTHPAVLSNYARHHRTGEPIPPELVRKIINARKFNQGYATTEYLAAVLLDLAYHELAPEAVPAADEIERFEVDALAKAGVNLKWVPPRYRSSYFSHIFADPVGYSAGYYAYIWSEILARDAERWFLEQGGLLRSAGEAYRRHVLSRGFSSDPLSMYEALTGAPPNPGPLLQARGLD